MVAVHTLQLLVPTKLTAPQPLAPWVPRERLLARLGAVQPTRLTLVVAPAGFGKSTLVAQWLSERTKDEDGRMSPSSADWQRDSAFIVHPPAFAWLTLDEHDQDGLRFLAYLAGAIDRAVPQALMTTFTLLAAAEPPPLYVVLQALLVDLAALPAGLTLVLDDYHTISAPAIHQAVAYLLRHLPPTCRLILLSRSDPPLPLTRLRAAGEVAELRIADLRFSVEETAALLTNLRGAEPAPEQVRALHQKTEGWAIALQLAALTQRDSPAPEAALGAATRQIADYLTEEVLARQPASIQHILLTLAVPERFCAGLGAALLGATEELASAESQLEALVRMNLFVIPLDSTGQWYRFHHLFRDLLLRRLRLTAGAEGMRTLHRRAAHWLAGEGLVEEALRHLLAAGEEDAAADLIERHMVVNMGRDLGTAPPGYWLRLLPPGQIDRRPGLALIEARLASFNTDIPALETSLARVDALLAAPGAAGRPLPWATFMGDRATLQGSLRYWQACPAEAIRHLESALQLGPVPPLASQALHILGKALVAEGRYGEGVRLLEDGLPGASAYLGAFNTVTRYLALCGMHATAGTVDDLARDARRLADEVAALRLGDFWICYAEAYRGRAAYERSDLGAAAGSFGEVVRRRYQINAPIYIGCLTGLGQLAILHGDLAAATAYEGEVRAFAGEVGGAFLQNQALCYSARLALVRGDLAAAREIARGIGPDIHQGINTWFAVESPRLLQARVLVLGGDQASLEQADAILAGYLAEVEPLHNIRLQIGGLATMALLRQAQGRASEALATLERAVSLAAPRGFVRSFVDLGPALVPLLRSLGRRGVAAAYLERVLAAAAPAAPAPSLPAPPAHPQQLLEMLTPRESEILALLAERWSDKEIAVRLVIAPNTVRKHTSTIYDKLGVRGRREAVSAARALGLLRTA